MDCHRRFHDVVKTLPIDYTAIDAIMSPIGGSVASCFSNAVSGGRAARRTRTGSSWSLTGHLGSRHRVVAYLGGLARGEASGWAQLGRALSGRRLPRPESSLFDPPRYDEPDEDEPVLVKLKDIQLERLRGFGDVWLAWGLWRLLELDVLLERIMPQGREEIPWPQVAAILTIARLCEPSSELHIEDTWYHGTALDHLLGIPAEKVHTDRLYTGLDQLLPHKDELERHLRQRLGDLFDLKYELLLYDITSTYFEGQCAANPMARRGYSRDSRPDCLQVLIGLVVTEDGFPLGYEVFAGNRHDSSTVDEMVTAMEQRYGRANRIWVMDRGMVSEENIARLHRSNASYIVGTPKAMLRRFERELTDQWTGTRCKKGSTSNRSPDPMARRFSSWPHRRPTGQGTGYAPTVPGASRERTAESESTMTTGHLKDEKLANRRLGRLLEKNWRAAGGSTSALSGFPSPWAKYDSR